MKVKKESSVQVPLNLSFTTFLHCFAEYTKVIIPKKADCEVEVTLNLSWIDLVICLMCHDLTCVR